MTERQQYHRRDQQHECRQYAGRQSGLRDHGRRWRFAPFRRWFGQEPTTQFFEQFKVDYAVIGASALDHDGDILDFDLAEVRVSKTIIRQSRKVFLVCDASKLDRSAPARLASLAEIDTLFTDRALPPDLARRCADWGTKVTIVRE